MKTEAGLTDRQVRAVKEGDSARLLEWSTAVTDEAQDVLNDLRLGTFLADNVAVLFRSHHEMNEWVQWCVRRAGMEHFHKAEHDTVFAAQDGAAYHVNFEFLRNPQGTRYVTGMPWRVEAMHVTGGASPIHERAMEKHEEHFRNAALPGFPVQVSFKVLDVRQFGEVHDVLRRAPGWKYAELFVGTYGMYSYWSHPDYAWFLKARVNMRD
jgi:hypothetical protein